jgi:cyclase
MLPLLFTMLSVFPAGKLYRTVTVADGIYAFVSPESNSPIVSGNVVAIAGDEGVLVVDSGRFPALARRMAAEIRRKTGKRVRYLVHTHWHLDHITGDGEFRAAFPGMTFLATDFTRRKILDKQRPYLRDLAKTDAQYVDYLRQTLARGTRRDGTPLAVPEKSYLRREIADIELEARELAGADIVKPDATFDRSVTIHLGNREVRIAFLGGGNTAGDAVISVPDAGVVVTGDLLVSPVPYGYGCHPAEWVQTLGKLMAMDAKAIVPGHGPVMHDWTYAKKVAALLESIRSQVGRAVAEGSDLEAIRERVDLAGFRREFAGDDYDRGRAFDDFFVRSAVERAYQEAKGEVAEE